MKHAFIERGMYRWQNQEKQETMENGPKPDTIVLSKAVYEALARDGLRSILYLTNRALVSRSTPDLEDWLNSIDVTSAEVRSLLKTLKSIT